MTKNHAAVALGRLGGLKRAKITTEQARAMLKARWGSPKSRPRKRKPKLVRHPSS